MKKICFAAVCIAILLTNTLTVSADYLDEYVEPARYKIRMETRTKEKNEAETSNRYACYLDVVNRCIGQYGETEIEEGPSGGMQHFTGLSFLKLIDFDGDGAEELFLVFHVRTNNVSESYEEHVYVYNVWGYDGTKAVLLQDGNHLYGFNGGHEMVFFVKNRFGTYFLHGAADSFQYDYYYGYKDSKFGLAKTLLMDERYDEAAKKLRYVYTVDGKNVSEEVYKSEAGKWGTFSSADEAYTLTFYDTKDRDTVLELIDETISFLQEHAESSVPQEEPQEPEKPAEEPEKPVEQPPFSSGIHRIY